MGRAGARAPRLLDQATIDAAFTKSAFADLNSESFRRITVGAHRLRLASKEWLFHQGDQPRCALVAKGFVRTVRNHPDGRELTVSWEYPGFIIGLLSVVTPPVLAGLQAVTATECLELRGDVVRERIRTDPAVGWAIARLANRMLRRAIDDTVIFALGDLRSRIEWRILESACRQDGVGTPLICKMTQDELATAVGATRPSVARILKVLRDEGTIRPLYGGLLILRPQALAPPPHRHIAV